MGVAGGILFAEEEILCSLAGVELDDLGKTQLTGSVSKLLCDW